MKPIIGIVSRSSKDNEDYSILYTNSSISKSIIKCGGIPILILPTQNVDYEEKNPKDIEKLTIDNKNDLNTIINKCDGIIIPGGHKWYEYDEYICKYAIDNDIPILGICAGMQLMAKVLNNNKKIIDNTIKNNTEINHSVKGVRYVHSIKINNNSLLYKVLQKEEIEVNSRHNYHIPNELSYLASAYSKDGIIEAIEYNSNKFTLGVQWHPETMIDYDINAKKILTKFINESKK